MNLNELRDKTYKIACEHGFHDTELSNKHFLCLIISELMEAVEADRRESVLMLIGLRRKSQPVVFVKG